MTKLTSETIEVLNNRVSVRGFTDQEVGDDVIEALLNAAFRAPTSSNIQTYSVIVVRDQAVKDALCPITGGQPHVKAAPVFLAFCVDLTRIEQAMIERDHNLDDNNLEIGLVSSIDAALVGMSAYLTADSVGLKGVMIGAVRNDAVATAKALGLPPRVYCVFGMCLGYPDEAPPQKPRMDYSAIVHYDHYGALRDNRTSEQILADYDSALANHYESTGKSTTPDSWTGDMDKKFNPQLRDNLRAQLKELGFDFR